MNGITDPALSMRVAISACWTAFGVLLSHELLPHAPAQH